MLPGVLSGGGLEFVGSATTRIATFFCSQTLSTQCEIVDQSRGLSDNQIAGSEKCPYLRTYFWRQTKNPKHSKTDMSCFMSCLGFCQKRAHLDSAQVFLVGFGKGVFWKRGLFRKSPFSRELRDSREPPDCGKQRTIRPFSGEISREFPEILEI